MLRRSFLASGLALPLAGTLALPADSPYRLLIGGDTDFAESYTFRDNGDSTSAVRKYGYDHSLAMLAPLMRRADYTVLNLETVFTREREIEGPDKEYRHWSDGNRSGRQLRRHGVDAVSLANNHTLDYGLEGLQDTMASLAQHNIQGFGAGPDKTSAARPHLFSIPAVGGAPRRVAIFGMFEYRRSYDTRHGFYADNEKGGTNRLDIDTFRQQVRQYRQDDPSLFVIAFPHWGGNYSWRTPQQAQSGRAMIDAGADMVIGHHGHCMQEIERYRDKWILYGIGNFMFNSPGRFDRSPDILPYGLAVELLFSPDAAGYPDVRLYPVLSDNRQTRYQPRFANAEQCQVAYNALTERSSGETPRHMSLRSDRIGPYIFLASTSSHPRGLPG